MKGIDEIQCPSCRNWLSTSEIYEYSDGTYKCPTCEASIVPDIPSLIDAICRLTPSKEMLAIKGLVADPSSYDSIDELAKDLINAIKKGGTL